MAQPNYAPHVSPPVSVIGPEFLTPYQFNIIVNRFPSGNLVITDMNNKIMITVKPCDTSLHTQRMLLDKNDRSIAILREKNMSAHDRWNVYRGESKSDSDVIFSTVSNHMIQFKTHVNVFLMNKTSSKDDCDFKIKGNWSKRNCTIYKGDSSIVVAQMHIADGKQKDKFMMTIYPNMDYAFVVALVAIVDAMESTNELVAAQTGEAVASGVVGSILG